MAGANQTRKKFLTTIALLIVLVGAFIIVRPRLWVKNKTAKVIVDGRLSEDVKLFHGSDERLLFYLLDDPSGAYSYSADSGLQRCDASDFVSLKLIVFSASAHPPCGNRVSRVALGQQSLDFDRSNQHITVSWQAAPR